MRARPTARKSRRVQYWFAQLSFWTGQSVDAILHCVSSELLVSLRRVCAVKTAVLLLRRLRIHKSLGLSESSDQFLCDFWRGEVSIKRCHLAVCENYPSFRGTQGICEGVGEHRTIEINHKICL